MGYLIFFLIMMVIISAFPYLMQLIVGIWLVSMVINLFLPNRRKRQQRDFTQTYQEPNQERPRPQGDVIDVEFTEHDDND